MNDTTAQTIVIVGAMALTGFLCWVEHSAWPVLMLIVLIGMI